ncbi:MAG: hypothetical protein J2P27_05765, partial [Actinobacteria bacterium]|nr:hypothetical protein [Actinomycetota bacterium]
NRHWRRMSRLPNVPTCLASPERRWRALSAPLIAGALGWILSTSIHLGVRPANSPGLPLAARLILICGALVFGLVLAVLIMRTRLIVSSDGLTDHRIVRVIQIPWDKIAGFEIGRPSALWGGMCVQAVCHDGATIDLMSTRAYSRIASARHVDELHRISWTLEQAASEE